MTASRRTALVGLAALGLWAATASRAQAQRLEGGTVSTLGYSSGSPIDRRPIVPATTYSSSPYYSGAFGSLADPIFMTTINYPGQYGAYNLGLPLDMLNREPFSYPAVNPRSIIPAISTTVAPLRSPTTPAGGPTLTTAPPSVTPAVPSYNQQIANTYPAQISAAVPSTGAAPAVPGDLTPAAEIPTTNAMLTTPGTIGPRDDVAKVVVRVPEDARLEFEGVPIAQAGRVREMSTPPLARGQFYHYLVKATWREGEQDVTHERRVRVYPGSVSDVDFLTPAQGERTLRSSPQLPPPGDARAPAAPSALDNPPPPPSPVTPATVPATRTVPAPVAPAPPTTGAPLPPRPASPPADPPTVQPSVPVTPPLQPTLPPRAG